MTHNNRVLAIGLEVLLWALSIKLILVFARAGWDKFDAGSGWARAFAVWGYPVWFRLTIGVFELAAAALLLWPRTAAYGAALRRPDAIGGDALREHAGDVLLLERLLRKTVPVAPALLNEYVGRYVAAVRPDTPITIERFADTLVSKANDMRDVLVASSDTEFLTRHHFGRGRFERGADGRVARLVYTEGPHEIVAQRT